MGSILFVVLLVVIGALLLRRFSSTSQVTMPEGAGETHDAADLDDDEDDGSDDEAVAITSDGFAFVPHRDTVQLLPVGGEAEWHAKSQLGRGDLIAARVKRGAPSIDPWRLEALGRDHDYRSWEFETESAARAAHDLLQRSIVRPPLDADGDPIPVGEEEYFVALRKLEESATQSAIDQPDDLEDDIR